MNCILNMQLVRSLLMAGHLQLLYASTVFLIFYHIHTVSQKVVHQTHGYNFVNS